MHFLSYAARISRSFALHDSLRDTRPKSQGSEYPVVILPLSMQYYLLLSRNLVYTGLTQARQLAILVGPTKPIGSPSNG